MQRTERWATFDCYGTLIDWNGGLAAAMAALWPQADGQRLLAVYHAVEPVLEEGVALPYREVLDRALKAVAAIEGLPLPPKQENALPASLPSWTPFPEVPGVLRALRGRGWKLGILSNTDPDLLAASLRQIGVPVDLTITAAEAGSYKPAPGHWQTFRRRSNAGPSRHVHVAASLVHDIAPAASLGIPAVWINRLGEQSDLPRAAELPTLDGLPDVLDQVIPETAG
jgi:2-haloacid dehalogenase